MPMITITEAGIRNLIKSLDICKAYGPDEVSHTVSSPLVKM